MADSCGYGIIAAHMHVWLIYMTHTGPLYSDAMADVVNKSSPHARCVFRRRKVSKREEVRRKEIELKALAAANNVGGFDLKGMFYTSTSIQTKCYPSR